MSKKQLSFFLCFGMGTITVILFLVYMYRHQQLVETFAAVPRDTPCVLSFDYITLGAVGKTDYPKAMEVHLGKQADFEGCARACLQNDACRALSYNFRTKMCTGFKKKFKAGTDVYVTKHHGDSKRSAVAHKKDALDSMSCPSRPVVWNDPRYTDVIFDRGADFGEDTKLTHVSSVKQCADVCGEEDDCNSFMYTRHPILGGRCVTSFKKYNEHPNKFPRNGIILKEEGTVIANKKDQNSICIPDTNVFLDKWSDPRYTDIHQGRAPPMNSENGSVTGGIQQCANDCSVDNACASIIFDFRDSKCYKSSSKHQDIESNSRKDLATMAANKKPLWNDPSFKDIVHDKSALFLQNTKLKEERQENVEACATSCLQSEDCKSMFYSGQSSQCLLASEKYNDEDKGNKLLNSVDIGAVAANRVIPRMTCGTVSQTVQEDPKILEPVIDYTNHHPDLFYDIENGGETRMVKSIPFSNTLLVPTPAKSWKDCVTHCKDSDLCTAALYQQDTKECREARIELIDPLIDRNKRASILSRKKLPLLHVKLEYDRDWESEFNEATGWVRRGKGRHFDENMKMSREMPHLERSIGVKDELSTIVLGPRTGVTIWEHPNYEGVWMKFQNTSLTETGRFSLHNFNDANNSPSITFEKDPKLGNQFYDKESSLKVFRVPMFVKDAAKK